MAVTGSLRLITIWPLLGLGLVAGCLPPLPENAKSDAPQRTILQQTGDTMLASEPGLDDALWLEISRIREPGTVGGYLSQNDPTQKALVVLLHSASTLIPYGSVGATRLIHSEFGPAFRDRGYLTWSLNYRECGTAYGQDDLADALEAIDWLDRQGKATLGVDRVFLVGYSAGATVATLTNRQRKVDGIVSISGLSQPDSVESEWFLYYLLGKIYPLNTGVCEVSTTVEAYGQPGSPGWDVLNTVDHIDELLSPMLWIHGTKDSIFNVSNARNLETRYEQRLAEGAAMPVLEFFYVEGVGHFLNLDDPDIQQPIFDFLQRFGSP